MEQKQFIVTKNDSIAPDRYIMELQGESSGISLPGQFINIALEGFSLRRPFSVCDYTENTLTVAYKVIGGGTDFMSKLLPGVALDVLTGLGNGFNTEICGDKPLIIAGGMGAAPLLPLLKILSAMKKQTKVILGFHTAEEIILLDEYSSHCNDVTVTTSDGSRGMKGRVTDAMNEINKYSFIYCCGPEGMMKSVFDKALSQGQYSFEERMGCGFGACMGCSRKTKQGYKRVCKDGPIFDSQEIVW